MSRFANPKATKRFVLGPCECPGTPDDEDWMEIRSDLSGMDMLALEESPPIERLRLLIVAWNLRADDGPVAPLEGDYLSRLYLDTFEKLNAWLSAEVVVKKPLPNGSGAHSRNGSPVSASPNPTIRKRR